MAAPQSPLGSRRRLGAELRRLRTEAGLTLDDVAERMTCSTSKISRLETGKGVPKVPDVNELLRIYGVGSEAEHEELLQLVHDGRQHGWWESYVDGVQPERFVMDAPSRYAALETEASVVRAFEIAWLHGLVPSRRYARAGLRARRGAGHDPAEVDALVDLRMARQRALADRGGRLQGVLDESGLARRAGGAEVMVEALDHVLTRAELPGVEVRVLPCAAGAHRALAGPFVILEFPPGVGADTVYVEGHAGETLMETAKDVELYQAVLDDVWSLALPAAASRTLIGRYRDDHAGAERGS